MEREQKKQKYLDKLKLISSKGNTKDVGILEIQNGNSHCINENHPRYVEPTFESNDLLAKVERYIKANPMSHITKNRLTIKRGFQSNLQNKNNIDSIRKSCDVQDIENVISFIKPTLNLVKYKPDTNIKFGPPNATSTVKHKKTQCASITSRQCIKPAAIGKNDSCHMNEKNYSELSLYSGSNSSTAFDSPKKIRYNKLEIKGFSSTISDSNKLNKIQCLSTEEKAKLNLKYCLYLEFVHSSCNEIKMINEEVNNDYSINLKQKLQQIKLKHQNEQSVNTNLTSFTMSPLNDKSTNYFNTTQSGFISNYSDFIFKPVNLSISPDICLSQSSQDSFICSTQETLFTNIDNSMNINQNKFELSEENFSFFEMCSNENNKNSRHHRKKTRHQSKFTRFSSSDSWSEKFIQKSNNTQDSSSVSSEDSFKYYRKSMF